MRLRLSQPNLAWDGAWAELGNIHTNTNTGISIGMGPILLPLKSMFTNDISGIGIVRILYLYQFQAETHSDTNTAQIFIPILMPISVEHQCLTPDT